MSRSTTRSKAPNANGKTAESTIPSPAAQRKAAMRARSGVERKLPEPASPPDALPTGKGRKGRKAIAIYMLPVAKDVLDKIAREQRRTVQDLGIEALNLLFRSYGEKPIA
jgi:hypothetical protein